MKCNRFFGLFSAVALSCVLSFGLANNVNAATITRPLMGHRAYSANNGTVYYDSWNSYQTLPFTLIGFFQNSSRELWGSSFEFSGIQGLSGSEKYKSIELKVTLKQDVLGSGNTFSGNTPIGVQFYTSNGNVGADSTEFSSSGKYATWTIKGDWDDNRTITGAFIRLGQVENVSKSLAYVGNTCGLAPTDICNGAIQLYSIEYTVSATRDPNTALLEQGNQLQQEANEIAQETQDFLTDDTPPDVDTDNLPSVGLLPAGPLDSLLGLPITLMTSISTALGGQCSPISIPLPYVNDTLPIPCFDSIFYSGNFAPLANVIGVSAAAVILYYWLKHLYKKVDRATSLQTNDEDEWGVL